MNIILTTEIYTRLIKNVKIEGGKVLRNNKVAYGIEYEGKFNDILVFNTKTPFSADALRLYAAISYLADKVKFKFDDGTQFIHQVILI